MFATSLKQHLEVRDQDIVVYILTVHFFSEGVIQRNGNPFSHFRFPLLRFAGCRIIFLAGNPQPAT
jgi:hypothetical protein